MKQGLTISFYILVFSLCPGCGDDVGTVTQQVSNEMVELSICRTVGSEIGDSTEVFGAIADVSRDGQGNILVLDQISRGVKVFTSEGDYICQIGRGGEGPGELALPMYAVALNNGEVLVHDPMNNAFIAYDREYNYLENVSLWDNGPPIETVASGDSSFAGILLEFDMERQQPMMIRKIGVFSDSREPDVLVYTDEVPFDFDNFTNVLSSMIFAFTIAADPQGRLFYSPVSSETYEIFCFDEEGVEFLHIIRDIPQVAKTEIEMEEEVQYIESWAARMGMQGVPIIWEPDPYRNFIGSLGVDDQNRLWVARGTETQPVFDVYSMAGDELFSAVLPVESSSWKFNIDRWGILGWKEDPEAGFQQLYLIPFPDWSNQ